MTPKPNGQPKTWTFREIILTSMGAAGLSVAAGAASPIAFGAFCITALPLLLERRRDEGQFSPQTVQKDLEEFKKAVAESNLIAQKDSEGIRQSLDQWKRVVERLQDDVSILTDLVMIHDQEITALKAAVARIFDKLGMADRPEEHSNILGPDVFEILEHPNDPVVHLRISIKDIVRDHIAEVIKFESLMTPSRIPSLEKALATFSGRNLLERIVSNDPESVILSISKSALYGKNSRVPRDLAYDIIRALLLRRVKIDWLAERKTKVAQAIEDQTRGLGELDTFNPLVLEVVMAAVYGEVLNVSVAPNREVRGIRDLGRSDDALEGGIGSRSSDNEVRACLCRRMGLPDNTTMEQLKGRFQSDRALDLPWSIRIPKDDDSHVSTKLTFYNELVRIVCRDEKDDPFMANGKLHLYGIQDILLQLLTDIELEKDKPNKS